MKRDEFLSTNPLAPFFFLDIECMVFLLKLYNLFELPLHREHRELIRESSREFSSIWVFRCWKYRGQETLVFVVCIFDKPRTVLQEEFEDIGVLSTSICQCCYPLKMCVI